MYNFQNKLNKSSSTNIKNTPSHAIEKPFPELEEREKQKLAGMFDILLSLSGRKYSTLSLNEKRLVEMFCKRSEVNSRGESTIAEGAEEFTVLKLSAYAYAFIVRALGVYFPMPGFKIFHIFEDEKLGIDELYGDNFKYSGSPFHDALRSFPNNYLPIRESRGKAEVFAVYSGRTRKNIEDYRFKERVSVTPNEALYVNPLLEIVDGKEAEKAKPPVVSPYVKFEQDTLAMFDIGAATPKAAAFINRYLEIPEEFHKRYNTSVEITEKMIEMAKATNTDSDAYRESYRQLV